MADAHGKVLQWQGAEPSGFNQTQMFPFEDIFNQGEFFFWTQQNWTLSCWFAALYVVFVWVGTYVMKNQPAFNVRPALILWSGTLATFSIIGAFRTVPEILFVLRTHGWKHSICSPSYYYGTMNFWLVVFCISKLPELADTVFIVLKKQKLIFLHWYHHAATFMYAWYIYPRHLGISRYFATMNFCVHAFMYTYYTLRALRVKLPRWISVSITTLQILQMAFGIFLVVNTVFYKLSDPGSVQASGECILVSCCMYASYLLLFVQFFVANYMQKNKKAA